MIYEIVNMSDPYTIEANSLETAFVACLFLGQGQYMFRPLVADAEEIPFFMFGGTEEWCQKHLGAGLEIVVNRNMDEEPRREELAACFESCLIGKQEDRETYFAGLELIDDPAKRERWRKKWHEDRLSSFNDIGDRAYEMAKRLRAGSNTPLVAPPAQAWVG